MPRRLVNIATGTLIGLAVVAVLWLATDGGRGGGNGEREAVPIGGSFALTRHDGVRVTDQTFRGRHMLIYFGYSYCPDVCPLELANMTRAVDAFEEAGGDPGKLQPVFITVDPERDTPEALAEYVGLFHPRLVGLTGDEDEIRAVTKAYRVYYRKARDDGSASDYLMDHSSIVYLMDPEGRYVAHFGPNTPAETMTETLQEAVG